jgi:hypothetical protein
VLPNNEQQNHHQSQVTLESLVLCLDVVQPSNEHSKHHQSQVSSGFLVLCLDVVQPNNEHYNYHQSQEPVESLVLRLDVLQPPDEHSKHHQSQDPVESLELYLGLLRVQDSSLATDVYESIIGHPQGDLWGLVPVNQVSHSFFVLRPETQFGPGHSTESLAFPRPPSIFKPFFHTYLLTNFYQINLYKFQILKL